MSQDQGSITVLGLDIAFRQGADMVRAHKLAQFVEERYEAQKQKYPGAKGKSVLLIFLALGLADELMQAKTAENQTRKSLENLLEKIEKSL